MCSPGVISTFQRAGSRNICPFPLPRRACAGVCLRIWFLRWFLFQQSATSTADFVRNQPRRAAETRLLASEGERREGKQSHRELLLLYFPPIVCDGGVTRTFVDRHIGFLFVSKSCARRRTFAGSGLSRSCPHATDRQKGQSDSFRNARRKESLCLPLVWDLCRSWVWCRYGAQKSWVYDCRGRWPHHVVYFNLIRSLLSG